MEPNIQILFTKLLVGTSYTGAWTWVSSGNGAAFTGLKDPNNNIAIGMYLKIQGILQNS